MFSYPSIDLNPLLGGTSIYSSAKIDKIRRKHMRMDALLDPSILKKFQYSSQKGHNFGYSNQQAFYYFCFKVDNVSSNFQIYRNTAVRLLLMSKFNNAFVTNKFSRRLIKIIRNLFQSQFFYFFLFQQKSHLYQLALTHQSSPLSFYLCLCFLLSRALARHQMLQLQLNPSCL